MNVHGGTLTVADLEGLAKCGIHPEIAELAKLHRVDSQTGAAMVGRNGSGNYAGIVFPYLRPGEERAHEIRLRRDTPEYEVQADGSRKEKGKYMSPPGRGNMAYFVPGTDPAWLADTALPVVLTEGEKKTLRARSKQNVDNDYHLRL